MIMRSRTKDDAAIAATQWLYEQSRGIPADPKTLCLAEQPAGVGRGTAACGLCALEDSERLGDGHAQERQVRHDCGLGVVLLVVGAQSVVSQ